MLELKEVHDCEVELPEEIAIEKYRDSNTRNTVWYHRNGKALNAIVYCPFCGEKLNI